MVHEQVTAVGKQGAIPAGTPERPCGPQNWRRVGETDRSNPTLSPTAREQPLG